MERMVKQGKIRKDFFLLAMGVFITVIAWVGFETYRAFTKSQVDTEIKKQVIPLTSEIDLDTMEEIKNRRQIPEAAWPEVVWEVVDEKEASPTSSLDEEKEATESAEI